MWEELPGRKVTNKFRAYIINYVESNTKHQLPRFLKCLGSLILRMLYFIGL